MSSAKKRAYNSEGRNIGATQTKNRILASAKQLFQEEGYEYVTIEKLARLSEVSTPTIYALFQSKRGILRALMDDALPADQKEALLEISKHEKSAHKWLEIAAKISRQLYDAERAQLDIFRGAAVLAPEFKELEKEREERRYARLEETVNRLAVGKFLLKELSITKARDILWTFTGRDMYRMLVVERGWTSDEYEKWLTKLLVQSLIGAA